MTTVDVFGAYAAKNVHGIISRTDRSFSRAAAPAEETVLSLRASASVGGKTARRKI
jgi:hypothetical protein